jgi:hypothetical protein
MGYITMKGRKIMKKWLALHPDIHAMASLIVPLATPLLFFMSFLLFMVSRGIRAARMSVKLAASVPARLCYACGRCA